MLARHNNISQGGFSLIEALIAFAVLSFGMMGVVTLLASSKTSQFEAVQRTRAVNLANSMVERVRINPAAAASTYNIGLGSPRGGSSTTEPSPNCSTTICTTPAALAAHDLWRWEQELRGASVVDGLRTTGGLVQPLGCIVFTADPSGVRPNTGTLQVVIAWRGLVESTDAGASGPLCGSGSDLHRRQVVVNTRIIDERDLANAIAPPPPPP